MGWVGWGGWVGGWGGWGCSFGLPFSLENIKVLKVRRRRSQGLSILLLGETTRSLHSGKWKYGNDINPKKLDQSTLTLRPFTKPLDAFAPFPLPCLASCFGRACRAQCYARSTNARSLVTACRSCLRLLVLMALSAPKMSSWSWSWRLPHRTSDLEDPKIVQ